MPPSPDEDEFTYHQRELISYARRDDPPFVVLNRTPRDLKKVRCHFPEEVEYVAAGGPCVSRAGRARTLPFEVLVYLMYFIGSRLAVLHLVLRWDPAGQVGGSVAEELGEFDVIKLAKLWEGGEGVKDPFVRAGDGSIPTGGNWLGFEAELEGIRDFRTLLESVRQRVAPESEVPSHPTSDRPYMTGSLQLKARPTTVDGLVTGLRRLHGGAGSPDLSDAERADLIALSGVLRTWMSFHDTHRHELASIFKQVIVARRLITAVHKGTFLRVADDTRMPSPYFLLPHSIALHNEYLLRKAESRGREVLDAFRAGGRGRRQFTRKLDDARQEIDQDLDERVSSAVIHYPNLRDLYETAAASRGLIRLREGAERFADELRREAETVSERQRTAAQTVIATVAAVFAGIQIWVETSAVVVALVVGLLMLLLVFFALGGVERVSRRLGARSEHSTGPRRRS